VEKVRPRAVAAMDRLLELDLNQKGVEKKFK
jgi:hypothetical protein